ncbi:hypothetical protein [Halorientalis marina]|jgi:hypothetical protein|uniref:hypothetical protein n=1 Tax=Halorientalis marina TaxID=2931976 RepID=UPI001FF4AB1B|nr:hypothetical protein [Halorientalis marina]
MNSTNTTSDADGEGPTAARWSLLGLGGVVSLCCLFAAPATTGAAVGTVSGGATAATGGGVVRVLVSALTVGLVGVVVRYRIDGSCSCE